VSGSSIADFFVKIGFKIDDKDKLEGIETALSNAAKQAGILAENLAKVKASAEGLTIPALDKYKATASKEDEGEKKKKNRQKEEQKRLQAQRLEEEKLYKQQIKGFVGLMQGRSTVKDLALAFSELSLDALVAFSAIGLIGGGLVASVQSSLKAGEGLKKFNLETGISVQVLQKWQNAAAQFGVAADEVTESFKNLNKIQIAIKTSQGKEFIKAFNLLGISYTPDMTTEELFKRLEDRAKQAKGVDAAIVSTQLQALGITPEMANTLRRNEFNPEKGTEGYIATDATIQSYDELYQEQKRIAFLWSQIAKNVGEAMLPFEKAALWVVEHLLKPFAEPAPVLDESQSVEGINQFIYGKSPFSNTSIGSTDTKSALKTISDLLSDGRSVSPISNQYGGNNNVTVTQNFNGGSDHKELAKMSGSVLSNVFDQYGLVSAQTSFQQ